MNNSNTQNNHRQLKNKIQSDINKIKQAKKEKLTLLAQTVYLGTLGFIFILPVIIGAYLGVWLDNKLERYFSISWTISLIFLGVIIGAANVYFFIKGK
ncbi:MAG: AtpZ/AtpI family protein [Gammaproteobacteria bacterium]|jgi:ATP synthase protein I